MLAAYSRPGMVVYACNPRHLGGRGRKVVVQGQHGQKGKTFSEKLSRRGVLRLRVWYGGRAPALQTQGPEFSPQHRQQTKASKQQQQKQPSGAS
jgi:hypothetical protein